MESILWFNAHLVNFSFSKTNKSVAIKIKFHLFVHSVSQQILACNHIDMSSVQNQVYSFRYFCMDHSHNETKKHD